LRLAFTLVWLSELVFMGVVAAFAPANRPVIAALSRRAFIEVFFIVVPFEIVTREYQLRQQMGFTLRSESGWYICNEPACGSLRDVMSLPEGSYTES
jgi:hypothetical protein